LLLIFKTISGFVVKEVNSDGVEHFQLLHPPVNQKTKRKLSSNNSSSVFLVQYPAGSAPLTSDIEMLIARKLLDKKENLLDIGVLIASQHGSNSSPAMVLIQASSPDNIAFATCYRNPYGFLDKKVVSCH